MSSLRRSILHRSYGGFGGCIHIRNLHYLKALSTLRGPAFRLASSQVTVRIASGLESRNGIVWDCRKWYSTTRTDLERLARSGTWSAEDASLQLHKKTKKASSSSSNT